MALLPANGLQIAEKSILDHFNRPVYLGQQYSVNKSFTIGASEIPLLYLNNSQTGAANNFKALFQNLFKMAFESASGSLTLNAYLDASVTGGTPVTPINMRPAYGITSIVGTVVSSPTVVSIGTLVDTISGSAAQPVAVSELLKILDNTQNLLITGIGSGAGLLCNVILQWYEI